MELETEFTSVLGSPISQFHDSDGKVEKPAAFQRRADAAQRNSAGRNVEFLGSHIDLTRDACAEAGKPFTIPEDASRTFRDPLRYRTFACDNVGETPVMWITSRMLRASTQIPVRQDGNDSVPCWKGGRDEACAPNPGDVYPGGLSSLLGVGSKCRVPLVRARACTGIRRQILGIVLSEGLLALLLLGLNSSAARCESRSPRRSDRMNRNGPSPPTRKRRRRRPSRSRSQTPNCGLHCRARCRGRTPTRKGTADDKCYRAGERGGRAELRFLVRAHCSLVNASSVQVLYFNL